MNQLLNLLTLLDIKETDPNEIVKHILIYLRKSRKDSEYFKDEPIEKTLQRHEEQLQRWAINNFGIPIPDENIMREVVSGDTIENRPAFQKVLRQIENPYIKAVLIVEIERLGRGDGEDQSRISKTFKYTKTKIITPIKVFDLENEMDLQFFEDNLYQSRKYLQYTKKILKNGVKASVMEGKWPYSICPYGYNKEKLKNEKGYTLVINQEEASVVREIISLFLNGIHFEYEIQEEDNAHDIAVKFGVRVNYIRKKVEEAKGNIITIDIDDARSQTIANYLNYLGISPRISDQWTVNMVRNILFSPTIQGNITYGKRATELNMINGDIKSSRPKKKAGDYMIIKGIFDPILDKNTCLLLNNKLASVATHPVHKEKIMNPLANLVYCEHCGRTMTRRPPTGNNKPKLKRVRKHNFTDSELETLSSLIHEHYINSKLSISSIARLLNFPRNKAARLLTTNLKYFKICPGEYWMQLKSVLNINDTSFDSKIMDYEEVYNGGQDILLCRDKNCPTIASNLKLVENKIIEALKLILKDYKKYINNQKKEKTDVNNLKAILENNLSKKKEKLNKIYELAEDGFYDKKTFLTRHAKITKEIKEIEKQINLVQKQKNNNKRKNIKMAIPKIENILNSYQKDELTAEQKNILLTSIIDKIYYSKYTGGRGKEDAFKITIKLKIKP